MELNDNAVKALFERLQRMESRIVRGFTEQGVVVCDDENWCRVDNERKEVHVNGLGRSIRAIQLAIARAGGDHGCYDVVISGETMATVMA